MTTAPQPSWIPEIAASEPYRVPVMACDMLAWRLRQIGVSAALISQVAALSQAIRTELGNSGSVPAELPRYAIGTMIEHRLVPAFAIRVEAVRECEISPSRPGPHLAYRVTDPAGNTDWLCAYDVQLPGQNLPWA